MRFANLALRRVSTGPRPEVADAACFCVNQILVTLSSAGAVKDKHSKLLGLNFMEVSISYGGAKQL